MGTVGLVDSTLCAAQGALWDGRATSAMLLPIVRRMGRSGFQAIDIMDGDVHEAAVRVLKEDPWRRIRQAAEMAPDAPLGVWSRGRSVFGDFPLSDALLDLAIGRLAACGVRRVTCYDALNDPQILSAPIRLARNVGLQVTGALVYSLSPVHTTAFYADRARALIAQGADAICLWDPAGILEPGAAREITSAIRASIETRPLEVRAHCRSGLAEIVYLEAVRAGADVLHTAAGPLAGGWSLPPAEYMADNLEGDKAGECPTREELAAISDYFAALAERHGLPLGSHVLRDFSALGHQLPGPVLAEFERAVDRAKGTAPTDDLLADVARIRAELGFPTMAMPMGRFVVRQALLNVAHGKRYQQIDPGIVLYLNGAFGIPPAAIDATLPRMAGPHEENANLKSASGSDDDRLIAAMCGTEALEGLRSAAREEGRAIISADTPSAQLAAELERRPRVREIVVRKGSFSYAKDASSERHQCFGTDQ